VNQFFCLKEAPNGLVNITTLAAVVFFLFYFADKKPIKLLALKINFWGKHEQSIDCFRLKLLFTYSLPIILKSVFAKSFNIRQK